MSGYADIVLPDDVVRITQQDDRLALLARLQHGAGVTILTGPLGAAFWSLASPEVHVRVVPDDYEYADRLPLPEWSYRAVGCSASDARELARRGGKRPTARHRLFHHWDEAERLREVLAGLDATPLVIDEFHFERWDVDRAVRVLEETDEFLALDWEWDTTTLEPVGLALAGADWAAYVPVVAVDFRAPDGAGDRLRHAVGDFLRRGGRGVWHGGRADLGTEHDADPEELVGTADFDDTMVMAYLLGEPELSLKTLTYKYLGREATHFPGNLAALPVDLGVRYAAADARNTYDLYRVFTPKLIEMGQWGVYYDIERPLVAVIASMERGGVPASIEKVKQEYRDAVALEQGMRRAVVENYGYDIRDDKQSRAWMTATLGSDPGTLDQRVLTVHPEGEVDLLLFYRRQRTLRRNFLGRILRRWVAAGREDGGAYYLHPRFNQAGSVDQAARRAPRSGRLSSSDPNLQNQPRAIRSIYVPPPGCLWWSFDYSGLELHLAAALSGDPTMLGTLSKVCDIDPDDCPHKPKCGDLHSVFQYKLYELTGRMLERSGVVKVGNFEQLYGGGAGKLVEIVAKSRTYIDIDTAKAVVEGHEKAFPGFHDWASNQRDRAARLGYTETLFGRRRYLPEFNSRDPERRAYAERVAVNHPIQGTGADLAKMSMVGVVEVCRDYPGAHYALQVHDEHDGWVPEWQDTDGFMADVETVMTKFDLPRGLRLKVEGSLGKSWAEAH